MMESERLLCVVCSTHITERVNQEDTDNSSNYLYFSQFCGELEKCEGNNYNEKPFSAKQFFHSVDSASSHLLICEECKKLISEAMKIRGSLEKWEMEVLRLQVELLLKLKELEKCNYNYFSKMSRIYDKVKSSIDKNIDDVGIKGPTSLSRDEVNLFREKILDVVSNLASFRDDLKTKLLDPQSSPSPCPASTTEPSQPEVDDLEKDDCFSPMQIDNIKHDPISNKDNYWSDNDNYEDFNANEEEVDFQDDPPRKRQMGPSTSKAQKKKPRKGIKPQTNRTTSKFFDNLPPLPFEPHDTTTQHKKTFLQYILIPPSTSPLQPPYCTDSAYHFLLTQHPWNYTPTSDTLTLGLGGTHPIQVIDSETIKNFTLKCSTCNYTATYRDNPFKNWQSSIGVLARKMFTHVVTSHLDGFRCPLGLRCSGKRDTLKILCKHLKRCHSSCPSVVRREGPFHCSICGQGLDTLKDCLDHEDTHKDKKEMDYVTCDKCGMSLLRSSLRAHKRKSCGVERPPRAVCQICGVSVSQEWVLKGHMLRKHAEEEEKRFECEVCGKKYVMEMDLKNHKRSKHRIYPEGTEMECRKGCGKKFTWLRTLCKHENKCDGIWRL